MPARSPFPAAGRRPTMPTPWPPRCARPRRRSGCRARFVEVIGAVDHYRTGTGYEITPVVGIVTPGFTIRADPREVADVFEVPLTHFLDEKNHQIDSRVAGPRAALLRHALRRALHLGRNCGHAEESAVRPDREGDG